MRPPDRTPFTRRLATIALLAAAAMPAAAAAPFTLGRCQTAQPERDAEIDPTADAGGYLVDHHGSDPRLRTRLSHGAFFAGAAVQVVTAPAHGTLAPMAEAANVRGLLQRYRYAALPGFGGQDRFTLRVAKDGVAVLIHYQIAVLAEGEATTGFCPRGAWTIAHGSPRASADRRA
jgi:hypothetical protein